MHNVAHLVSHPSSHETARFFFALVRAFLRLR